MNTFNVAPGASAASAVASPAPAAGSADRPAPGPPAPPAPTPPIARPLDTPVPPPSFAPGIMVLDKGQFAAADIGRLPSTGARDGSASGAGAGADSASVYGPGEGPGGERLFNAEWLHEPSRAEIAGYLPPTGAPAGAWATIACRTAERYAVENCRALGEYPLGSGLARAMRQAAWQFRVRPPRIGGRPLVGAWVRIRIGFDKTD